MMESPNLSYIHQLSGGDLEFEKMLLAVVKKELPDEISVFKSNIQQENFKEASGNVHKLKHKISILGLEKSYHFAEIYEEELREGINTRQDDFQKILEVMLQYVEAS